MSNIVDAFTEPRCYTDNMKNCIENSEPCGSNPAGLSLCLNGGEQMPRKPKRPCSFPGCPNLTDGRYCKEHEKQENKRYEKYDRDPAVRRRYGRAWKRIRDSYVAAHPLCEECERNGKLTRAEEVHHILPLSGT